MVQEIKISLMERITDQELEEGEENKDYIIRSSVKFKPREYFDKTYRDVTSNEKTNSQLFENFLSSSLDLIFGDLKEKTKEPVDSVGIWIDTGNENLEIAMSLKSLDEIGEYGETEIIPIYELFQMARLKDPIN